MNPWPTDSELSLLEWCNYILKEKTGITDQHLNQNVEQSLLKKLAVFFDSWEKYVESPGLNLKMENRNPYATYGTLVEVLVELNERTLADQVCKTAW